MLYERVSKYSIIIGGEKLLSVREKVFVINVVYNGELVQVESWEVGLIFRVIN